MDKILILFSFRCPSSFAISNLRRRCRALIHAAPHAAVIVAAALMNAVTTFSLMPASSRKAETPYLHQPPMLALTSTRMSNLGKDDGAAGP